MLDKGIEQKICSEVITDYYYHSIYCSKNEYLSLIGKYEKLPNFIIFLKQQRENISFSAKDLFLEQGNNIYEGWSFVQNANNNSEKNKNK